MEVVDEPEKLLATQVLKQAARDGDFSSRDTLSFWCEVVDVEPAAFFERARRVMRFTNSSGGYTQKAVV